MYFSTPLAWMPVSFRETWMCLLSPWFWQLFTHCAASCAPCQPAREAEMSLLSAGTLTPQRWCLEPESWKAQVNDTCILSQMSLKTAPVVLLHRAATNQSLASLVAGCKCRVRPVPWSSFYISDNIHLLSFTYSLVFFSFFFFFL